VIDENKMSQPPLGASQMPSVGDAPVNADGYPTAPDTVYFACVLTGNWPGEFKAARKVHADLGAHYVRCLYEMVSRHAPRNTPWRFVCFTDRAEIPGVPCRPILPGLYSYFSKLFLFSSEAFPVGARVIYFDLDTRIVGDLTPLTQVALDNTAFFLRNEWDGRHLPASGVMSWIAGKMTGVWRHFEPVCQQRPPYESLVANQHTLGIRTDEEWLHQWYGTGGWSSWQDTLPGHFSSAKRDTVPGKTVIYYHGRPRPHEDPQAPQYVRI
jgi:hypothetical protein